VAAIQAWIAATAVVRVGQIRKRKMQKRVAGVAIIAGFTVMAVSGGGVAAWAAMTVTSDPVIVVAEAAEIPTMPAPTVELVAGLPTVSWHEVVTPAGAAVDGYVVVRRTAHGRDVACTVTGSARRCLDDEAPAGSTVRYTVRATEGLGWQSRDSAPSAAVTVPVPGTEPDATPPPRRTEPDDDASVDPSPIASEPAISVSPATTHPSEPVSPAASAETTAPAEIDAPSETPDALEQS
jgi:hypothetical protein